MICEKCKQKQATTFLKQTINGKTTIYNVCNECAKSLGAFNFLGNLDFDLNHLFSGIFSANNQHALNNNVENSTKTCPNCGITLNEIARIGKIGCDKCYSYFYDELIPTIEKIHGKAFHTGKIPKTAGKKAKIMSIISKLKSELNTAISNEDFETAARIRDEIKSYQNEVDNNE